MEHIYSRSRFVCLAVASLAIVGVTAGVAVADTITLGWNDSDPTIVGYMLHVGTQSGNYTQHLDVGFTTTYGWTGAVAGQRYCFAVSAYAGGHLEGSRSNEVCGYSNQPPTLVNPGTRSSVQGQPTSLQLQGSDPDGQPVSYTASGMPPGLSVMVGTGFISGTPTTTGTYNVTATVSDGVLTTSQTFAWTVTTVTSSGDATLPSVTITGPTTASTFTTTTAALTLSGAASDNIGVTQVTWANDRGGSGTATGTANWSAGLTLVGGSNVLTVTARDAAGNTSTDTLTVTYNAPTSTTGSSFVTSNGTGLTGVYYKGFTFDTTPVMTRVDPTVNFSWGYGSPTPLMNGDSFVVRWTGTIVAPVTGSYVFSTVSDEGVRLWVNNQLLIDHFQEHTEAVDTSVGVTLQAGQQYPVRLEYYEAGGVATIQLRWTYPGQATQIVPQNVLFAGASAPAGAPAPAPAPAQPPPVPSGTGLRGDYIKGFSYDATPVMTRVDPTVNFAWGLGSPTPLMTGDGFVVRWTGTVTAPATGTYFFSTVSDDGARLWVNNQLLIDHMNEHTEATDTSVGVQLQAGQKYSIRLDYYEAGGSATIKLLWAYPGMGTQIIPQSALNP